MKKILPFIFMLFGCASNQNYAVADIYSVDKSGVGKPVGEVVFKDTCNGMDVKVNLQHIPQGNHGFHIHENPDCRAAINNEGKIVAAHMAGNHYDPEQTGKHFGPENNHGHKGDLPQLTACPNGKVNAEFHVKNLKVKEIRHRSVVIHEHGDNYQDTPQPLGGGGARIACGIIK